MKKLLCLSIFFLPQLCRGFGGAISGSPQINAVAESFSSVTITNMTSGSVIFSTVSGQLSQDNTKFFWDDTNNRLGIANNTPAVPLDVTGAFRNSGQSIVGGSMTVVGVMGVNNENCTASGCTFGIKDTNGETQFYVNGGSRSIVGTTAGGAGYSVLNIDATTLAINSASAGTTRFNGTGISICSTCTVHVYGSIVATASLSQSIASCATGIQTDATGKLSACVASDRRLKKNIRPLGLSKLSIDGLKPVFYQWKNVQDRDAQVHAGFIAQDVFKVFPAAVINAGNDDMKGIDPNAMIALLVQEIQILKNRIASLEKK